MQPVSNLLPILLRRFRHAPSMDTAVWRALWKAHVGAAIMSHSEVVRFQRGILTVRVDHPAWRQQLSQLKSDLILTLNKACGKTALTDIQFLYRADSQPNSITRPKGPSSTS